MAHAAAAGRALLTSESAPAQRKIAYRPRVHRVLDCTARTMSEGLVTEYHVSDWRTALGPNEIDTVTKAVDGRLAVVHSLYENVFDQSAVALQSY